MIAGEGPLPARFGTGEPRNLLCTILFLDLVGYSSRSVDDQARIKQRLNALVTRVMQGVPADSWLAIDTGDGAALCFLGDPQEGLQAAMLLRDLLGQRQGGGLPARIGLHMGPVRVVADINHRVNVVGDGINVAQRIMDFALPNQIVVSRACFDILSRIANDTAGLLRYAGVHEDKHGRLHELHVVRDTARGVGESAPGYRRDVPDTPAPRTAPVIALEQALTRHIGPLARLLVDHALADATPLAQLPRRLAAHIEHAAPREAFHQEALRIVAELPGAALKRPDDPPRR